MIGARQSVIARSTRSSRVEGRGNPVAVAKAVRRRVFNLIEIATSLGKLGMSGCSSQ